MKKISKRAYLFISVAVSLFLLVGIFFLIFGLLKESIFVFIPIPLVLVAFFSFFFPKDPNKVGLFIFSSGLRFICSLLALLGPMLIWKFVPSFKEVSPYYIFASFIEVISVYILTAVNSSLEAKESK